MRSSFWWVMRSLTRRKGSGSIKLTNSQGMTRVGSLVAKPAHQAGRGNAVQETPGGARQAHVHLRDAQFDGAVDALLGEINIVHADDFSAAGIDNLLVEQVLAHGQPRFIGLVMFQVLLFHIQADHAGSDKGDVIVTHDQGKKLSPAKEDPGHTVGLVGGLDEQFGDLADEMAVAIVGFSAQKIGSVQHFASFPKPAGREPLQPRGLSSITIWRALHRGPQVQKFTQMAGYGGIFEI